MPLELRSGTIEAVSTRTIPGRGSFQMTIFAIDGINVQYCGDGSLFHIGDDVIVSGKNIKKGVFRGYCIYALKNNTVFMEGDFIGLAIPIISLVFSYNIIGNISSNWKIMTLNIVSVLFINAIALVFFLDALLPWRAQNFLLKNIDKYETP